MWNEKNTLKIKNKNKNKFQGVRKQCEEEIYSCVYLIRIKCEINISLTRNQEKSINKRIIKTRVEKE